MRTRAEMKTVAKQNFSHYVGAFVAAAAILLAVTLVYSVPAYVNNWRNLQAQNFRLITVENTASAQNHTNTQQTASQMRDSGLRTLLTLIAFIVLMFLQVGLSHMAMMASTGDTPTVADFFSPFKRFGRWLGLTLMMGLRIFLWTLLFFIPGIIAALRYSQAIYLMLEDPNLGINQALRQSRELMRGNKGKLFVLDLSFLLWDLLVLISCSLASLYVSPYRELTTVQFYFDLRRDYQAESLSPSAAFATAQPVYQQTPTSPTQS